MVVIKNQIAINIDLRRAIVVVNIGKTKLIVS
jgi:hypothetical protein